MSFDNHYPKRKDWRQPYRKSKAFDRSCRNGGRCSYCRDARLFSKRRELFNAKDKMMDASNVITQGEKNELLNIFSTDIAAEAAKRLQADWRTCDYDVMESQRYFDDLFICAQMYVLNEEAKEQPIPSGPITEEWLTAVGFVKDSGNNFFIRGYHAGKHNGSILIVTEDRTFISEDESRWLFELDSNEFNANGDVQTEDDVRKFAALANITLKE